MYTGHFELNGRPFAITPDPRYLYLSERHREALAHLLYGVTESGGFILLTGEVGTGKTTLTRTLLQQLPPHVDAALVYNPRATLTEFLETICDELRVERQPGTTSPKQLTDALNRHLLAAHERGRRTVLIVDEAQNLSPDLLEQIRLLTNLETHTEKLLQILLIGQPELRDMLARNELRQVAQRITARYHLEPLSETETTAYVRHRLEVAGARRALFQPAALRTLHRRTGGIPRLINIICDRALLGAYAEGATEVDSGLMDHAAHEVRGETQRRRAVPGTAIAAGVLVAVVAGAAWLTFAPSSPLPVVSAVAESVPVPARVAEPTPVSEPEPEPEQPLSLAELFAGGDHLDKAAAHLLTLWEAPAGNDLPASLCNEASAAGLACVRGRGTWNNLRMLGRPALLELRVAGTTHTALLERLDDATATLWVDGEHHSIPLLALDRAWFGEYLLLWRPPVARGELLRLGTRGDGVRELRDALAYWRAEPDAVNDPTVFDAALEARVRAFQQALGLEVDGIAGEQTLVHLDGLTGRDGPRLHVTDS